MHVVPPLQRTSIDKDASIANHRVEDMSHVLLHGHYLIRPHACALADLYLSGRKARLFCDSLCRISQWEYDDEKHDNRAKH